MVCGSTVREWVAAIRTTVAEQAIQPPGHIAWFGQIVTSPTDPPPTSRSVSSCVVRPPSHQGTAVRFTGTIDQIESDPLHPRPRELRRCHDDISRPVPCSTPHSIEVVAEEVVHLSDDELGDLPDGRLGPVLTAAVDRCLDLAARFLGVPVDHHDRLDVVGRTPEQLLLTPASEPAVDPSTPWPVTFPCALRAAEGQLVDTLAGVGTGPLPWE